jgi:lipopolysaccharide/colanic/teichoic acid biosynthesis glycosyltransferase
LTMNCFQRFQKRTFDVVVSLIGLLFLGWLILLAALIASIDTGLSGLFSQERVGKNGKIFHIIKVRSMRPVQGIGTFVTTDKDPRITKIGMFWRKTKIDELPQLWNVLTGDMSFVGPRPDVLGFADRLRGQERLFLAIRPEMTGPATLKFKNEEVILGAKSDPEKYNREVIWPEKVRLNLEYINNYSLLHDMKYILKTINRL